MKLELGRFVKKAVAPTMTLLVLAGIFGLSPAQGALTGYNPCLDPEKDQTYGWMGDMHGVQVTVPTVASSGPSGFEGAVFGPTDVLDNGASSPKLPAVVFQGGGQDGDICDLVWAAKYLAGKGYITEIHQTPGSLETDGPLLNGLRASASAVSFLRSSANPYARITDPERIGVAGYLTGASVASYIQGNPPPTDPLSIAAGLDLIHLDLEAIVALDNLSRWASGDWGAGEDCSELPRFEVTPRVPAMGLAPDEPCPGDPARLDPYLKQSGWSQWRAKGIPSMDLVLRDFESRDFVRGNSESRQSSSAYWVRNWFDLWLRDDSRSMSALTRPSVDEVPVWDLISTDFKSAVCLSYVSSNSYRDYLKAYPPPIYPGFIGECETPSPPYAVGLKGDHIGVSTKPLVVVESWARGMLRLYDNASCEGDPVAEESALQFGTGIAVRVARGTSTSFHATVVNPWHGQESVCSESSATYTQMDPMLTRPVLRMPRSIRAGTKRAFKITVRNRSLVAAENVRIKLRSTNHKVRLPRQVEIERIDAGEKASVKVALKAGKAARGKVRITATVAGKEGSRVVRIRR